MKKNKFCSQFKAGTFVDLNSDIGIWKSSSGLSIGTYHSGKGVEFDSVLLPGLDDAEFPDAEAVRTNGQEYAEQTAGRLLYVGVTRARATLIMSHTGTVTSLLPTSGGLTQRMQV